MGHLSTHVLDTMHGSPAAGMTYRLHRLDAEQVPKLLREGRLNGDGRTDGGPLLEGETLVVGRYRLEFEVAAYFAGRGVALPEPAFLGVVPLEFGVADPSAKYHVPLLASPWSFSTYRGS